MKEIICPSEKIINISYLNISGTKVNDEGIIEIAKKSNFINLMSMNLDNLVISGASFSEIMNSETLPKMFDVQGVFKYY